MQAGLIGMCDVTELEYMYSARSHDDRVRTLGFLAAMLAWVPMPERVFERAREVQALLSKRGLHRSAGPVDLQVAATAELTGLTLLHQDHDVETVAKVTGQPTCWLLRDD